MNKVLALAVHPDDETLGCGGTLLKHKANGDSVYWLIATNMCEESGYSKKDISQKQKEIETVATLYDFDEIYNLELPTKRTDRLPISNVIEKISQVFNNIKPNIVYLPFIGDIHSDHRIISQAAYSSIKTFRYPFIRKTMMMETISETEFAPSLKEFAFVPNYFVDISNFLDKKLHIIKAFKNEVGHHPFPRSVENIRSLAAFRGAMAGCKYAESFVLLKEIW